MRGARGGFSPENAGIDKAVYARPNDLDVIMDMTGSIMRRLLLRTNGNPIAAIIGKKRHPFLIASLIEQASLEMNKGTYLCQ